MTTIVRGGAPEKQTNRRPPAASRPAAYTGLLYVGLLVVPLLAAITVAIARTDAINPGGKTHWPLGVLALCLIVTILMGMVVARQLPAIATLARNGGVGSQIARLEWWVLIAAAPVGVVVASLGLIAWAGRLPAWPQGIDPLAPLLLAASGILVITTPVAIFTVLRDRRIRAIESRLPDLLRDLNESHGAGMTMAMAIQSASRGDYGSLSPEIHRMAYQVSWGTPFQEALRMFGDRVGTPLVRRATSLIIKATNAGGNVGEVIGAAARDARELELLDRDRRTSMALYVVVIYVSFVVFLAVVAALQGLLVPSLLASTMAAGDLPSLGGFSFNDGVSEDDFRAIYLGVGLVQGIGSGLVAGVMSEGGFRAGLKHTTVMVAMAIVALAFI